MSHMKVVTCPMCDGTGKLFFDNEAEGYVSEKECPMCGGKGTVLTDVDDETGEDAHD